MYTHHYYGWEFNAGVLISPHEFMWIAAHEFGHNLGLTSHNPGGNSSTDDLMGRWLYPLTEAIVQGVLEASRTGQRYFLP